MSPQADDVLRGALARCDREIAEIRTRADVVAGLAPAWLVTLGIEDWESERRALLHAADPARWPYTWRWKARLPERQGWPCRVTVRGSMNSALVAFPDGFEAVTSRNALRRRTVYPPTAMGLPQGAAGWPGRGATGNPALVPTDGGAWLAQAQERPSVAPPPSCPPGHAGQAQLDSGIVRPAVHKPAPVAVLAAGA
jgi:hypothetical protein